MKPRRPHGIPDWLAKMPKKAKVNARDFANALCLSAPQCVYNGSLQGSIPKPDVVEYGYIGGSHDPAKKHCYWYAATIRNEIRRRIKANSQ